MGLGKRRNIASRSDLHGTLHLILYSFGIQRDWLDFQNQATMSRAQVEVNPECTGQIAVRMAMAFRCRLTIRFAKGLALQRHLALAPAPDVC